MKNGEDTVLGYKKGSKMKMNMIFGCNMSTLCILIFVTFPQISFAYIGPGLALGTIILTVGVVAVLLLAILAILYYPIKKVIKNIKLKKLKNK